ncbi:protein ABHD17C isoform X2 [Quillaja saponaria]|uniref:Protein ABHD17C isoform X2 n=1 Tax=Quillaja saponaria TaxID=32244 RepID=A0AAD7PXZ0_QUISA|nr:protein ABHD17C isoform X2 [Quillaja saponaria]
MDIPVDIYEIIDKIHCVNCKWYFISLCVRVCPGKGKKLCIHMGHQIKLWIAPMGNNFGSFASKNLNPYG